MKTNYAFYFDANLREEEFDRVNIESHVDGNIVKTVFIRGTYLATLHDEKLIRYFNIYNRSQAYLYDNLNSYFVTLDRGIYTEVWLDLLTQPDVNLPLNLIEFSLPAKVRTQKRKHWHDKKVKSKEIPKVRGVIKDKILKEL